MNFIGPLKNVGPTIFLSREDDLLSRRAMDLDEGWFWSCGTSTSQQAVSASAPAKQPPDPQSGSWKTTPYTAPVTFSVEGPGHTPQAPRPKNRGYRCPHGGRRADMMRGFHTPGCASHPAGNTRGRPAKRHMHSQGAHGGTVFHALMESLVSGKCPSRRTGHGRHQAHQRKPGIWSGADGDGPGGWRKGQRPGPSRVAESCAVT